MAMRPPTREPAREMMRRHARLMRIYADLPMTAEGDEASAVLRRELDRLERHILRQPSTDPEVVAWKCERLGLLFECTDDVATDQDLRRAIAAVAADLNGLLSRGGAAALAA
jgi:hypothetical protein